MDKIKNVSNFDVEDVEERPVSKGYDLWHNAIMSVGKYKTDADGNPKRGEVLAH